RVSASVTKARDAARKRLRDRLPISDVRRVAKKLERIASQLRRVDQERASGRTPPHRRAVRWAVEARVARRAARLSAAIEDGGAVYLPERLHGVRVAVKKQRYAVELLAQLDGQRRSPAVAALRRVQEVLGRMHDLQVLIDHVRAVQASLAPPNLTVWHELDALVVALDESCRRLHARYIRERDAIHTMAEKFAVASTRETVPAAGGTPRTRGVRRAG